MITDYQCRKCGDRDNIASTKFYHHAIYKLNKIVIENADYHNGTGPVSKKIINGEFLLKYIIKNDYSICTRCSKEIMQDRVAKSLSLKWTSIISLILNILFIIQAVFRDPLHLVFLKINKNEPLFLDSSGSLTILSFITILMSTSVIVSFLTINQDKQNSVLMNSNIDLDALQKTKSENGIIFPLSRCERNEIPQRFFLRTIENVKTDITNQPGYLDALANRLKNEFRTAEKKWNIDILLFNSSISKTMKRAFYPVICEVEL